MAKKVQDPFAQLRKIQKLALTAICSDDDLMERLVLKGGTAIDLIHGIGDRSSIDLDFSMEGDFREDEKAELRGRLEKLLDGAFRPAGMLVFDVTFQPKPMILDPERELFWGGYKLMFKVIDLKVADAVGHNLEKMQRQALRVGTSQEAKFEVEISRREFCADKVPKTIDGYQIYVYTPRLIVCEKLRAICQQMPEYSTVIKSKRGKPRARDFFDIFNLVDRFGLDVEADEFPEILSAVFAKKHVPLELLDKIQDVRGFHESSFPQVKETVSVGTTVFPFEHYFDFVVELVRKLKAFRNVEPPAR